MSESENHKQKKKGCGCGGGGFKEAKLVVLVPYNKAKKFLHRCGKSSSKKNSSPDSSSGERKFVHCCFCFKKPSTLESSAVDSVTSDPNDPNFTFEMLRNLIETNDFYSKECNPHLDPSCSSFSVDD